MLRRLKSNEDGKSSHDGQRFFASSLSFILSTMYCYGQDWFEMNLSWMNKTNNQSTSSIHKNEILNLNKNRS